MKDFLRVWWYSISECGVGSRLDWSPTSCGLSALIMLPVAVMAWGLSDLLPMDLPLQVRGVGPKTLAVLCALVGSGALLLAFAGAIAAWVAIRRFEHHFGFLPPLRPEARDAFQPAIRRELQRRAEHLAECYADESRQLETLRAMGRREDAEVDLTEFQDKVRYVESRLRNLKPQKRLFKSRFYGARDAAKSHYLPWHFVVLESYADYLTPAKRHVG